MRACNRGFTLVEMLVALAISTIIFTIGLVTISATIEARREYTDSVHASECARQFFSLLEHDLAAAYQNGMCVVSGEPGGNLILTDSNWSYGTWGQTVSTDILQFYTQTDSQDMVNEQNVPQPAQPDEELFVRYYINHPPTDINGVAVPTYQYTLCRQIFYPSPGTLPENEGVPPSPGGYTSDNTNPYAIFDGVRQLQFQWCYWDPTSGGWTILGESPVQAPTGTTPPYALQVKLTMQDKDRTWGASVTTYRQYQKIIVLPECFQ